MKKKKKKAALPSNGCTAPSPHLAARDDQDEKENDDDASESDAHDDSQLVEAHAATVTSRLVFSTVLEDRENSHNISASFLLFHFVLHASYSSLSRTARQREP